jgi:conjugative relaxase-like TrwC/TraI family protein
MIGKRWFYSKGGVSAADYYLKELSASEYYHDGKGKYQGRELWRLGLEGRSATLENFEALEHNRHPDTGERITPRTNDTRREPKWNPEKKEYERREAPNRRTGIDITFLAPKTFAEYMVLNPDQFDVCLKMMHRAWQETMEKDLEPLAKTRVRIGNVTEDRQTANLVYLSVVHTEARPSQGSDIPDPLVHIHTYIKNMTWDGTENRFKAVQMDEIVRNLDNIDARFMARLERYANEAGMGTERTADGRSWELTSVTKEGKALFSKRRNEILAEQKAHKIRIERTAHAIVRNALKTGKVLDYATVERQQYNKVADTIKRSKNKLTPAEKLAGLRAQVNPEIEASLSREAVMSAPRKGWQTVEQAKAEVLESVFKTESVAHEMVITGELLRRCGGANFSVQEAVEWVTGHEFVAVDELGHFTTPELRSEERSMRHMSRDGWDKYEPLGGGQEWTIRNPLVASAADQAASLRFLLQSRDLVMDVSGICGAGKTTLLKEAIPAIEGRTGRQVICLAPTSPSMKHLKKDFKCSETLQMFMTDTRLQDAARGQMLALDECSMVSVPQMRWLINFAQENGCRLITLGDTDQHHSVERGDAIRILQESGAVRSVQLTENYRAKTPHLKSAVYDLKWKKLEEGWETLDQAGGIIEIEDPIERRVKAMEKHLEPLPPGELSILACPIHAEAREVAAVVRQRLKEEGLIEQENHEVRRIQRLKLEGLELKDPIHYQEGRVVRFRSKVQGGFKSGEKWQVTQQHDGGSATLQRNGVSRTFKPKGKGQWDLYESSVMELSVGDQIRTTETAGGFDNNEILKVSAIEADKITVSDGRTMPRDFLSIDQGHCITSYATECSTVRRIVPLASIDTFAQMDRKTFYVLVGRATHEFFCFTDCKEALREATLRDGDRKSIWEYERDAAINLERKMAQREAAAKEVPDLQKFARKAHVTKEQAHLQAAMAMDVGRDAERQMER